MTERRKRLIEVAFPLEEVSEHSRREKYVSKSHISTLHLWWARRPLAASRAFIYASLVDDPQDDSEREELLKEVADMASWDAVRHSDRIVRPKLQGGSGLTGDELLARARKRILDSNGGKPPRLLDPFSGGGAIPLEALRLGCQVEASDLNPVAVIILKATIEYPQKYGQPNSREVPEYIYEAEKSRQSGQASFFDSDLVEAYRRNPLATDVRYWGNWTLAQAKVELEDLYPPDPDGSIPMAYLWSRTVPCPNCHSEMPLIRQYWLARKATRKVALKPVVDHSAQTVDFRIVAGDEIAGDPAAATTSGGDTMCLMCHQVAKVSYIHEAGRAGLMGARMTSVVAISPEGVRNFREVTPRDGEIFHRAVERRVELERETIGELPAIPDEPLSYHPQYMLVREYGLDEWGKLFNARQLVSVATFAKLVHRASEEMRRAAMNDEEYVRAVITCLGLWVDKIALRATTCGVWHAGGLKIENIMGDGTLPMAWDYPEACLLGEASGSASTSLDFLACAIDEASKVPEPANVRARDARDKPPGRFDLVLTDPPYYDAINYADLSDFFYVWLKRSIGFAQPDLLALPLTPKREQAVMNVYAPANVEKRDRREAARERYIAAMAESFQSMSAAATADSLVAIVFAHTDPAAWATLIEGLLAAVLVPDASWPIDTESQTGSTKQGKAKLKTSVWMACRPQSSDAGDAFVADVMAEMRPVMRERLLFFWGKGIRGADFFISAIGPALSVFGRHSKVMRPDGSQVTVRDFLELVRRESTHVALEQVLQGADLGAIDPATQQYVTWVWSSSRAPLDTGEAIALCLATGADYGEIVRPGAIATEVKEKSKKLVKLRTIKERGEKDEELGLNQPARPAPLIDQLQRAAWLWSRNQMDVLGSYRAALGESRWTALRTLGNAVAGCLPDGDEDKRLILGVLSSSAMGSALPRSLDGTSAADGRRVKKSTAGSTLPGFEEGASDGD